MPYCVTSTMSVNNLNQVRDGNDTSVVSQSDNNNIINNNNNNNNNNKVNNVSKINTTKITVTIPTGNIGRIFRGDKRKELNRAPSMANCLSITIPIHPAASETADRERIIPPLLKDYTTSYEQFRLLARTQILFGGILMFWSYINYLNWRKHQRQIVDNSYWSNIFPLISGSCGLFLLYCLKKERPGMRPGFCLSATKMFSLFIAVLTIIACLNACVLSAIHLDYLHGMECTPAQVLNATCVCRPRDEPPDSFQGAVRYMDLSCNEIKFVEGDFLISCVMNFFNFICVVFYTKHLIVYIFNKIK